MLKAQTKFQEKRAKLAQNYARPEHKPASRGTVKKKSGNKGIDARRWKDEVAHQQDRSVPANQLRLSEETLKRKAEQYEALRRGKRVPGMSKDADNMLVDFSQPIAAHEERGGFAGFRDRSRPASAEKVLITDEFGRERWVAPEEAAIQAYSDDGDESDSDG